MGNINVQKAKKETLEIVLKDLNKKDEFHFLFGHQRLGRTNLYGGQSYLTPVINEWRI